MLGRGEHEWVGVCGLRGEVRRRRVESREDIVGVAEVGFIIELVLDEPLAGGLAYRDLGVGDLRAPFGAEAVPEVPLDEASVLVAHLGVGVLEGGEGEASAREVEVEVGVGVPSDNPQVVLGVFERDVHGSGPVDHGAVVRAAKSTWGVVGPWR